MNECLVMVSEMPEIGFSSPRNGLKLNASCNKAFNFFFFAEFLSCLIIFQSFAALSKCSTLKKVIKLDKKEEKP